MTPGDAVVIGWNDCFVRKGTIGTLVASGSRWSPEELMREAWDWSPVASQELDASEESS